MVICGTFAPLPFEYFNNYLAIKPMEEKTALHEQKIDKYRHMLRDYDAEVQEWLVSIYASHGKYMTRQFKNFILNDYFLLFDSEAEFRALSYEIYPKVVKRFSFLEGQSEMIYLYIKDEHKVRNLPHPYDQGYHISDEISEWIDSTYRKYGVNIYNFCWEWVSYFFNFPEIWPKGHKQKGKYDWEYDYKQKNNLFGLDALYRNMPKKSFTKDKKQEFEIVLMYCWLHGIDSDDTYWDQYTENVL